VVETLPAGWASNDASLTKTGAVPAGGSVTVAYSNTKLALATRTLGFWQTHTAFTSSVFAQFFPNGMNIGVAPHKGVITNVQESGKSQLFGAFYASISKTSIGISALRLTRPEW
jgi:hypothetical protein